MAPDSTPQAGQVHPHRFQSDEEGRAEQDHLEHLDRQHLHRRADGRVAPDRGRRGARHKPGHREQHGHDDHGLDDQPQRKPRLSHRDRDGFQGAFRLVGPTEDRQRCPCPGAVAHCHAQRRVRDQPRCEGDEQPCGRQVRRHPQQERPVRPGQLLHHQVGHPDHRDKEDHPHPPLHDEPDPQTPFRPVLAAAKPVGVPWPDQRPQAPGQQEDGDDDADLVARPGPHRLAPQQRAFGHQEFPEADQGLRGQRQRLLWVHVTFRRRGSSGTSNSIAKRAPRNPLVCLTWRGGRRSVAP